MHFLCVCVCVHNPSLDYANCFITFSLPFSFFFCRELRILPSFLHGKTWTSCRGRFTGADGEYVSFFKYFYDFIDRTAQRCQHRATDRTQIPHLPQRGLCTWEAQPTNWANGCPTYIFFRILCETIYTKQYIWSQINTHSEHFVSWFSHVIFFAETIWRPRWPCWEDEIFITDPWMLFSRWALLIITMAWGCCTYSNVH